MEETDPIYCSIPVDINNNADTVPTYSQGFGGRHVGQALITKLTDLLPTTLGINVDLVSLPINCKLGCGGTTLNTNTYNAVQCSQLNMNINEKATQLRLRSELPHLTRRDVVEFRLPFYDILCHELLQNGYHRAFTELFKLYEIQEKERRHAGPDSSLWLIPPLSEQPEKLQIMAEYLAMAELAARRLDEHTLYTAYFMIGLSFRDYVDELWVAEHFFKLALEVAQRITDDDGLKLAMANQHYGLILQNQGYYTQASEPFKQFYQSTRNKHWKDENGQLLRKLAPVHLVENLYHLIDQCPSDYHSDRLQYCQEALKIAIECGDWQIEGKARLKLGQLLEAANQIDDAIALYREYFEVANTHEDHISLGKACEALAKLSQSQRRMEDTIHYLQKFASICEKHGHWVELGRACQLLGTAYDSIGEYSCALKWMKKAFNLPNMIPVLKQQKDELTMESARIMLGVSRAHLMNTNYVNTILKNTPKDILKITDWKADPKDEDKLFSCQENQLSAIKIDDLNPKRDVLLYAKHPASGFLHQ